MKYQQTSTETSVVKRLENFFDRLWPINRSITGEGFRKSLDILSEVIPTNRLRFETGKDVFDWTIPKEWVVHDAYFIDPNGKKHADFQENNLHLMGYSSPYKGRLPLEELRSHLYSFPDLPDAIPYITSYYKTNWGFCIPHNDLVNLPEGIYDIHIDTEHIDGYLEVGEAVLPGNSKEEVLFSTYLCHPSMANNELSGPLVMSFLYDLIKSIPSRRYTYRFAITSETIGTIAFLSERGIHLKEHLIAGYVMTCLGLGDRFTYKLSRQENSLADRAAKIVLRDNHPDHTLISFDGSSGSDEKQYCSPGFNFPVGSLMRTMYGHYKEYHTSYDNKNLICFDLLANSVDIYYSIVKALESNFIWENTVKYGVPQLGKRGLFPTVSASNHKTSLSSKLAAILWLLNLSDGENDILSIAERSGHKIEILSQITEELEIAGLIKKIA